MRNPELSGIDGVCPSLNLYDGTTEENLKALKKQNYKRLVLNDGEFNCMSLASHITHLHNTGGEFTDLDDFYSLVNLEVIFLQEGPTFPKRKKIDLGRFLKLRKCTLWWDKPYLTTLFHCPVLEDLDIYKYKGKDLAEMEGVANSLKKLRLSQGALTSTNGIEALSKLEELELVLLPKLQNINSIGELKRLKTLNLQSSKHVVDLGAISKLSSLEHLILGHCFSFESFAHLEQLKKLKTLMTTSQYEKQDFEIFFQLPNLEIIEFMDLENYVWTEQQWMALAKKYGREIDYKLYNENRKAKNLVVKFLS